MRESESEDEYFSDAFESHERNETNSPQPSESQTLEPDVDPLRIRKENEDRMTQEERDDLKKKALSLKDEGNTFYTSDENDKASEKYTEAIEICPLCFSNERAILFANRAAVHLKNDDKDSAISDCTTAIELKPDYVKALIRRGQTFENSDKPHEALKDFEKVLEIDPEHKDARFAVMRLPEKIRDKDERLKAEMMESLKKLGDMVLRPFGLSTNNFNMVQDPNSGGYSINFTK